MCVSVRRQSLYHVSESEAVLDATAQTGIGLANFTSSAPRPPPLELQLVWLRSEQIGCLCLCVFLVESEIPRIRKGSRPGPGDCVSALANKALEASLGTLPWCPIVTVCYIEHCIAHVTHIHGAFPTPQVKSALSDPTRFARKGFSLCMLAKNDELFNPATEMRSTRNIEIDLSSDPDLT